LATAGQDTGQLPSFCATVCIQLKPGTERVQALADILRSALCCHSNETYAPIANPPNSAQLKGTPYHSPKLHSGLYSSVGMRPGTDRQTAQTALTTIHFASAMPHAKYNQEMKQICNSHFDNAKFTSFDHGRASTCDSPTNERISSVCEDSGMQNNQLRSQHNILHRRCKKQQMFYNAVKHGTCHSHSVWQI